MLGRVKAELRILDLIVRRLQASALMLLCTLTLYPLAQVLNGILDCPNL